MPDHPALMRWVEKRGMGRDLAVVTHDARHEWMGGLANDTYKLPGNRWTGMCE